MLTKVYNFFSSFFKPLFPERTSPNKRPRVDSADSSSDLMFFTPKKRRRLQDITMGNNDGPELKSVETQTESDVEYVIQPRRTNVSRFYSQAGSKENWGSPVFTSQRGLGSRSLNRYKAPAHCKSPNKVKQKTKSEMDEICIVYDKTKPTTSTPNISNVTLDRMRTASMSSLSFPFRNNPRGTVDLEGMEAYSRLLGSCLPASLPSRSIPSIDLTKEDRKEISDCVKVMKKTETVDLTSQLASERKKAVKEHIVATISLDDDEEEEDVVEVVPTERVAKVNSFGDRINKIPCTSTEWIDKILAKHKKAQEEFEKKRERAERYSTELREGSSKQIDDWLNQRVKRHLFITNIPLLIEDEVPSLPELSPHILKRVNEVICGPPSQEVLVNKFGYQIRRKDLHTLKGLNWLNDEVINIYMSMLMDRSSKECNLPKAYCFSTFFYENLSNRGYTMLRRWTRKVDLFVHDIIIIPVHLQMHWCLASIHLKEKQIKYYDSMGHPNDKCLKSLLSYLVEEYKDKKGGVFSTDGWTLENIKGIPQQMNGSDCGMFACTFAEYICRNAQFTFDQSQMPYFRNKMIYEILTAELMM